MNNRPSNSLIYGVVVLFVVTVAAVVVLQVAASDPDAATTAMTALLAALPTTVAVLANMHRTNGVAETVGQVQEDTSRLVNGLMDAKVRTGVADVLDPELIDVEAHEQLAADRERLQRETGPHE